MVNSKGKARATRKSGNTEAETSKETGTSKQDAPPQNTLVEWAKSIVIAVLLFVFLRSFLVQTFVITSGSMEETLLVGDMLMVNRASIGSRIPLINVRIPGYSTPKRLDVLVFDPPHEETLKLVKRLVGMPGDTLHMTERVLYVNGKALDEPYLQHSDVSDEMHPWMEWQREFLLPGTEAQPYAPTRDNWGPLVIPDDRYFMMGDNRETSLDSRYWGLLEGWRFEGRAVFTYFSYNKESYRPFPWIREIRAGRIGRAIR